jgi:dTDP-glucose 4,6-dehydratase
LGTVIKFGIIGEVYNVGGNNEKTNLEVVKYICKILDRISPRDDGQLYSSQITFIEDRAGHDVRYAINSSKLQNQLDWLPEETFETGVQKTVKWYLDNSEWLEHILSKEYYENLK